MKELKMNRMMVFLAALLMVTGASAIEFYEGPVHTSFATIDVNVRDSAYQVKAIYRFTNFDSQPISEDISFPGYPASANIKEGGVEFDGTLELQGNGAKEVTVEYSGSGSLLDLNPEVLIDGKADASRIGRFALTLLSDNSFYLTSSNIDFAENEDKTRYTYDVSSSYSKYIKAEWDSKFSKIYLERTATPFSQTGEVITIKTKIKNIGETDISNIILGDSFLASNFEPASEGFTYVDSEFEPVHSFKKIISSLKKGEEITVEYQVKVKHLVNLKLHPANAYVDGKIISSSPGRPIQPEPKILEPAISDQDEEIEGSEESTEISEEEKKATLPEFITSQAAGEVEGLEQEQTRSSLRWIAWILIIIIALLIIIISYNLFRRVRQIRLERSVNVKSSSSGGSR